jgi:hypothetical protein
VTGSAGAARAYAALLRLYPREFRDEFGADMSQLFRDQLADEAAPRVVARAVLDLALTLPQQHLEVHVRRNSTAIVSVVYLSLAAAGLATALLGGTNRAALIGGALLAVVAGALGIAARRRAATVSADPASAAWWKLLLAGPLLIGGVIAAAGLGVNAWYAGMVAVLAGLALFAAGVVLGVVRLFTRRPLRAN